MKTKILTLVCSVCIFIFYACDDEEPESSVIHITEDIFIPATWETGKIYIIDALDLWITSTLTIQPGVIVKFTTEGAFMSVGTGGSILANGTFEQPIVFTSIYDDLNGGDNNSDGTLTVPEEGDWAKILVETSGSIFNYCIFQYGGGYSALSALDIYGAGATIINCTFANNTGGLFGHYRGALDATNAEDVTVIRNNVFYSNQVPLSISSEISLDNSNIFHNPDEAITKNTMNGIFIFDYDNIDGDVVWEETEVAYIIDDGDFWINSGELSLATNVILKFTANSWLKIAATGAFNFNSDNIFTSFPDDSYLGDANGDGTSTTPENDYWGGIYYDLSDTYYYGENIFYNTF